MWQHAAAADLRSIVVVWPASAPATSWDGAIIVDDRFAEPLGRHFDEWPLPPDCIAPRSARDALRSLRVHPADISGEQLQAFVPELSRVDQDTDRRLVRIAHALSRAATVHAAATHLAADRAWDLCCVVYPFLADVSREFMRFRSPTRSDVPAGDVAVYDGVVDAAYGFADAMLGKLLGCIDQATTVIVVSPPGTAKDGFLAARGPDVRRDVLVHGVALVDMGPTMMNLLAVRVDGLDGRCIEAVSAPLGPERAVHVALRIDQAPNEVAKADDGLSPTQQHAVQHASLAWMANAAEAHLAAGQFHDAAARYAAIVSLEPHDWLARARLARCHLHLEQYAECLELATPLVEERPTDPWPHLLCAAARVLAGDATAARPHLAKASEHGSGQPAIAVRVGMLHLAGGDWLAAEACFRESLGRDRDSSEAYDGLGCALHAQARYAEAADAFRAALAISYHFPLAHVHLAMSLAALGRWNEAAHAAGIALGQDESAPGARAVLEDARGRANRPRRTAPPERS